MKACPFCAEEIQDAAVVCKHCGRDLAGGASQVQIVQPQKKQTGCLTLGCVGLVALVGVFVVISKCAGPGARDIKNDLGGPINMKPSLAPIPTLTAAEAKKQRAEQEAAAKKKAAEEAGKQARLFRENHRLDDGAREFIFRGTLRQSGERCDSIDSARMSTPGTWIVTCSPGYTYRFRFDTKGNLIGAAKWN